MTIEYILLDLQELLKEWGIREMDWILVSQYAYRLLGYRVKVRKGHFNILVRKNAIPWIIKEGVEIHPPHNTKFRLDFEKFIRKTSFDFDINLATEEEFAAKEGFYDWFSLPNSILIKVQKPSGAIKEFEKLLALSTKEGFGEERLEKDIFYIKDMIKALEKKKENEILILFQDLLKKYQTTIEKRLLKKENYSKALRGIIAYRGKVSGRVRIVFDIKDAKKVKKGDILVSEMTSPKFTIFFPKLSAIVTDRGGMLSHAAILSREVGIPCLVGTQIATKVFKDGDLVNVDAEKGFVRKLDNEKN